MKWLVAMVAISSCLAAALSRVARIPSHIRRGGELRGRRIGASMGLALGSLGWAAAVLHLMGVIRRGPKTDWALLLAAAVISAFMSYTLWRVDTQAKGGGDVFFRQEKARKEFERVRMGLPPEDEDEER